MLGLYINGELQETSLTVIWLMEGRGLTPLVKFEGLPRRYVDDDRLRLESIEWLSELPLRHGERVRLESISKHEVRLLMCPLFSASELREFAFSATVQTTRMISALLLVKQDLTSLIS